MSEELLPCPFCGSDHVDLICMGTREDDPHVVECDDCDATASGMDRAEAVANWNRRAGRTCRVVRSGEPSPTGVPRERRCSECGGMLTRFGAYCHNCGARVVGE